MVDDKDGCISSIHVLPEHPRDPDPLLHVKVGTRFVQDVEIGIPGQAGGDGNPLEFAP